MLAVLTSLSLGLGVTQLPASAGDGPRYRARLFRMLNQARERHDLRPLDLHRRLSRDAKRHTRQMIRKDEIYDPRNLASILAPYSWDDLGASAVGCAHSLRALHRAWMRSDPHREILLHPKLRKVGIGVVLNDTANACGRGSFWGAELFFG